MTDPFLVTRSGWWWPLSDTEAHGVIMADCEPSVSALLPHIKGRDLIIQAGANVGLYPVELARHFQTVITCEPDPINYACLLKNLRDHDEGGQITALYAAFGEREGGCLPVAVEPRNCGAHRVSFTAMGTVPVWTIDGLELEACDAIWLDCEGSELFALKAAIATIDRFSPVLAVEDKGLDHQFFGVEPGSLQKFLTGLGYAQVDKIGRDKIFTRTPKP